MPSDGKLDHQPPVYVLHRFANGGLVTRKQIREQFGLCRLVPYCTICNMGLGAYHGADDRDRRIEIVGWFLEDKRFPLDRELLEMGRSLLEKRLKGKAGADVHAFPGVGRVIYLTALLGLIEGDFHTRTDFPDWLRQIQTELASWLREGSRRKPQYFLDMANLASYDLLPHARGNPRGRTARQRLLSDI